MYGEILDFRYQHQQTHKIPKRKINFCSKFAFKTLPRYRALMLTLEVYSLSIDSLNIFVPHVGEI